MKTYNFKKVKLIDNEHVECIINENGIDRKIVRKLRKHTREIRELQKEGIYCFEIQGVLYWYCVKEKRDICSKNVILVEYKKPENFRSEERKGNNLNSGFSVELKIPEVKQKVKTKTAKKETKKQTEIYHEKFDLIKTCIQNDIPVYLVGEAGTGKSFTLEQVSWELGIDFYSTNSVQQEYKLTGFIDAGGTYHETEFYKAFKNGGIFFLDELDASIPEVLVLLNAAIENKYFEFPNGKIEAHKNFRVVAAGNTVGSGADELYTGRMVLDQSTLDRFVFIDFGYDKNIELFLADGNEELVDFVHTLRDEAKTNGIRMTFSYRCIRMITKLEKAGLEIKDILSIAVFKGLSKDTINCFCGGYGTYWNALIELQRVA